MPKQLKKLAQLGKVTVIDNRAWQSYTCICWLGQGDPRVYTMDGRSLAEAEDNLISYLHRLAGKGLWSYNITESLQKGCTDTQVPLPK